MAHCALSNCSSTVQINRPALYVWLYDSIRRIIDWFFSFALQEYWKISLGNFRNLFSPTPSTKCYWMHSRCACRATQMGAGYLCLVFLNVSPNRIRWVQLITSGVISFWKSVALKRFVKKYKREKAASLDRLIAAPGVKYRHAFERPARSL